jgi:ferric-dicitrate binding protein FerR (iron transport regulator)
MKFHNRILSILILLASVPFSALMVRAQDSDYDSDNQPDAVAADSQGVDNQADVDQGADNQADVDESAIADNQPSAVPGDNQPDPPARAARLQYMSGSVSVQPHGTDDWVAGALNRPLTIADNVWADKNSRAEISLGTALIRIDSESSLTLTNVTEDAIQLTLHQGALYLHVRRVYDNEKYEVDTPNQAFSINKPGDYRFDVDSDGDKTVVTVWRGEGVASGDGPSVRLREGQQARFTNGTSMTNDIHRAPAQDGFDEWAASRDNRYDHSESARYVSPDVPGYEDLDEYGTWRETPDYGSVWVPSRVDAGWAPYREGHWIWVAPWGWTWVDDEPWGYAPFHYGRWVYYNNYWGWAPGPIYERPYYAPALVAWFGGGGWGVGVGFGGGYGWCPLGFGEPYIPWYGVSRGYFNRVNYTNTRITNVNITNIYNNTYIHNTHNVYNNGHNGHQGQPGNPGYPGGGGGSYGSPRNNLRYANMRAPNGFTAVSRDALVNSRNVARNQIRVSPNQLSRVSAVHSLNVRPTRTTMLGSNAGRSAATPPSRSFSRPVVSRMAAPNPRGNGGLANRSFGGAQRSAANLPNNSRSNNVNRSNKENRSTNVNRPNSIPDSNARATDRGGFSSRNSVPRPSNPGGFDNRANNRGFGNNSGSGNTSPRYNGGKMRQSSPQPSMGGARSNERPAPAPRNNAGPRDNGPRSNGGPRSEMSVPRPPNSTAPHGFSSADRGPAYQANNRPSGSSNSRPSYGRSQPSYGGGSYGRSTPSYGAGSNSRPSPSYGGGNYGRSMPSYGGGRSAPSYGGGSYGRGSLPSYGGGRSAPSYGGGRSMPFYGGGHSSGGFGGGRSSGGYSGGGGGGGHASASHSSGGGGGGGGHSGGNNHGGRH